MTNSVELLINTVDGWMPQTRLYCIGERYWLITIPDYDVFAARMRDVWGVTVLGDTVAENEIDIFEATYEVIEQYDWRPDEDTDPNADPPGPPEFSADGQTATWMVNGARWGGMHREKVGEVYQVTPIDADGDPLNGLTPWAKLPAGTTFDQAVQHIVDHVDD